ncbi:MAG: hypothetical protein JXA94_07010 [Parachlamydiales bacterium]|nr:hypothetical protein [Parachlamydiales bacterium]
MSTEANTFYLSDVYNLILRKKYILFLVSFLGFLITFLLLLQKPLVYESEAIFYEASEQNSQPVGNLKDLILSQNNQDQINAISFFQTKKNINNLISKLGLNIEVVDNSKKKFYERFLINAKKNIFAHLHKKIEDDQKIIFQNVKIKSGETSQYYLIFSKDEFFEILDKNKTHIAFGKLNELFKTSDFEFVIKKVGKKFLNSSVLIKIYPPNNIWKKISSKIDIKRDKNFSKNILISYKDQDRKISSEVVNTLIDLYMSDLKSKHEELKKQELEYLESRKKHLEDQLSFLFKDFENYLKENVKSKGFLEIEAEIKNLLDSKEDIFKKITDINYKLKSLENIDIDNIKNSLFDEAEFLQIVENIDRFANQKQLIELSINDKLSFSDDDYQNILNKEDEIKNLKSEKQKIESLILSIKNKNNSSNSYNLPNIFRNENFLGYLNQKLILISKKIDLIKQNEHSFSINSFDLNSVKNTFLEYGKKLDDQKLEIEILENTLKKLQEDFQISLVRPYFSYELIKNVEDIIKKLSQRDIFTKKETERILEDFEFEKKNLFTHLKEILDFKIQNQNFLKNKLFELKKIEMQLVNNEISYYKTKLNEFLQSKKFKLNGEKKHLLSKIENIKNELDRSISKINIEKKINYKSDLTKSIIDSLTKLIESKTLDFDLKKIQSKPIDLASTPLFPISKHLILYSLISFIAVGFFSFMIALYIAIIKGFPISTQQLFDLGYNHSGNVSFKCNGYEIDQINPKDLETLRNIISNVSSDESIITLYASKGPNYIHYLSALLAIIGKKILVIETRNSQDKENGLYTYLERKTKNAPIQKLQAYDYLPSGEEKYFSFELLNSSDFYSLIKNMKTKYDHILLYTNSAYNSAESKIFLKISDKIILTIKDEILDNLKIYADFKNDKSKINFVSF